jgi:hypothetical protein
MARSSDFDNPVSDSAAANGGSGNTFESEGGTFESEAAPTSSSTATSKPDVAVMPESLLAVPIIVDLDEDASARDIFEEIDTDGDGQLDSEEIAALMRRLGMTMDVQELADAVSQMDSDGDGTVDLDEFEVWWAERGATMAKLGTTAATKVQEWQSLLVEGRRTDNVKENARDRRKRLAEKTLAEGSLINPEGAFRRKWDFMQMFLLSYVAFGVPYRLGFSHPVVLWSIWFWFDACVDVYFLSDIIVSFRTAYYNSLGELVVQPDAIRRNYLRTWFPIDASSCFPGNYISCESLGQPLPASCPHAKSRPDALVAATS